MAKSKKLKSLTGWDWEILIAACRYYEYRHTIASASFPAELVSRFFTGAYDEKSCKRIATQFVKTDHPYGESDWTNDNSVLADCDNRAWCKLWAFLNAYLTGFTTVVLDGNNGKEHLHDEPECFYCEYTKRWYPKDSYLANPWVEQYCADEFIKETKPISAH